MHRRPLLILTLIACALSPLVSGCGNLTDAPQATPPVVDTLAVKHRSLEIQQKIADLFPAQHIQDNDLPGPYDKDRQENLLKCEPILSSEYWNSEDKLEGVQYAGGFTVQLDRGTPVESVVDHIVAEIVASPTIGIDPQSIPDQIDNDTILYTTDDYQISVSYDPTQQDGHYLVDVYVWSPCFIPETMPPGREI